MDTITKHFDRNKSAIKSRLKHMKDPNHACHSRLEKHLGLEELNEKLSKVSENKSSSKNKSIDKIYQLYKSGLSLNDIIIQTRLKRNTVEQYMLQIFENYDVNIDLDYFEISENDEEQIRSATKKIGKTF